METQRHNKPCIVEDKFVEAVGKLVEPFIRLGIYTPRNSHEEVQLLELKRQLGYLKTESLELLICYSDSDRKADMIKRLHGSTNRMERFCKEVETFLAGSR